MAAGVTYYCEKCNRTMNHEEFYGSNNSEKYKDGKLRECKKCITMHVDNFNPDTYLWILQECDVPYIPEEWNKLLATYAKDKSKLTGMTILGRYLSKMKLKQFRDYRWKDNQFLQELAQSKIESTMKRQGYDAQEIALAVNKAINEIPCGEVAPPPPPPQEEEDLSDQPQEDYFSSGLDIQLDLTPEDITHLRLKWGKTYKPDEWVRLEQLYDEMMESYDIQTAGHIDTLILVCKTSLKANQLLDIGDVEGAQKMIKMYDNLMKAGKFTAAQNKSENGEYVDSISELVALCERDGFIPRYYVDGPQDKVDYVIQDMQDYTRTLITEEMHLGALIEKAVKQIEDDRLRDLENELDSEEDGESEEDSFAKELFAGTPALNDEDFEQFADFLEADAELNKEVWGDD